MINGFVKDVRDNKEILKDESSSLDFNHNKFIQYLKYIYDTIDENEPPEVLPITTAEVKKLTPKQKLELEKSLETLYKYRNNPEFQKIPLPLEYYKKYDPSNPIVEKYIYAEKLRNAKSRKEQIKITIDHYEKPELFD